MSYIKRNLENVVRQVTREYPVLLVTGPRQVGKTTMLQKLMEGTERGYVTLDDLNERNIAKTDPELFLQLHKPPVLIDEVQYAPELFTYIKINVDKNHEPGAFWLTGSQVFKLMQGVQESLAGRVAVLSLTSLSQAMSTSIPAFVANIIFLLKETSVFSAISLMDLMFTAKDLIGLYYKTTESLFLLVVFYLLILLPVSIVGSLVERRMRYAGFGD